jgi:hypothetical protein
MGCHLGLLASKHASSLLMMSTGSSCGVYRSGRSATVEETHYGGG